MHVVVAMSGGVDSSVAAVLLRDAGHRVTGAFLRNGIAAGPHAARGRQGCCGVDDAHDAAGVAARLDVPFYALDYSGAFDGLIADFARAYAEGRTPNPCIACNRDLKMGRLLQFARSIGADAVATGHYARLETHEGRHVLRVPADARKDQTYVLFPLSQEQLARTVLPLGELQKDEVRDIARKHGLPVSEKPESMEICFVPGGDYRAIVAEREPGAMRSGSIVDGESGDEIGQHAGVGSVTVGQRRGLRLAAGEPRYVTSIDPATNTVVVAGVDALLRRVVEVTEWNAVASATPGPGEELPGRARVRRNHVGAMAVARGRADGRVDVTFDEPVRAPAPGQALVLYDDEGRVLGGGWIASSS